MSELGNVLQGVGPDNAGIIAQMFNVVKAQEGGGEIWLAGDQQLLARTIIQVVGISGSTEANDVLTKLVRAYDEATGQNVTGAIRQQRDAEGVLDGVADFIANYMMR